MHIVVAPDSFKGSLSASEVAQAVSEGLASVLGDEASITPIPLADGGEGTLDALLGAWGGTPMHVDVRDAIGRPRRGRYGLDTTGRRAIIEAAEGNGLPAVLDAPLQPLRADSSGVGELVRHALDRGATEILLCIGGSASTDGGTGMLRGLGARFLDRHGEEVALGGAGLADIADIDLSQLHPMARSARWRIAVDVDNPLVGPRGAAAVFGPQKGASPTDVAALDAGLRSFCALLARRSGRAPEDLADAPGLGAAGGLPLAPLALLGAEPVPGSRLVSDALELPSRLAGADVVITGEGSLDSQSLEGKVVDLVRRTAPSGTPIVVLAGRVLISADDCRRAGITAAFSIAPGPSTLDALIGSAAARIRETAAQCASLLAAGIGLAETRNRPSPSIH